MKILRSYFFLISLLFSSLSFSAIVKRSFQHPDFDTAEKSPHKLQFTIKSTKLGMITSSVDGYAKNFQFKGDLGADTFQSAEVTFQIRDLDTDNNSRNEKMHMLCLGYDKFKVISIKITAPVRIGNNMVVPAIMNIRGKDKNINLNLNIQKKGGNYLVDGSTLGSFKNFEIPDPSIFIAKVSDEIKISFKLKI